MKPIEITNADAASTDFACTTSRNDASRFLAWVSLFCAVVFGCLFAAVFHAGSIGVQMLIFGVIVVHLGQTLTSAISTPTGARFAFVALTGQLMFVVAVLIGSSGFARLLPLLFLPVICSVFALVIDRRHSAVLHREELG